MDPEDVVNVLRKLHQSLAPRGLVIDAQPVAAQPVVTSAAGPVGRLDMTEWAQTIEAVDRPTLQTVEAGLFRLTVCRHYAVIEHFDTAAEMLEEASTWAGAEIPDGLADRIAEEPGPIEVHQRIRLRRFEAA